MVQLDVCDDESVKEAVAYVMNKEGRIDVLINNAGFGLSGAIEETSADEAISQLNTNFSVYTACAGMFCPLCADRRRV